MAAAKRRVYASSSLSSSPSSFHILVLFLFSTFFSLRLAGLLAFFQLLLLRSFRR